MATTAAPKLTYPETDLPPTATPPATPENQIRQILLDPDFYKASRGVRREMIAERMPSVAALPFEAQLKMVDEITSRFGGSKDPNVVRRLQHAYSVADLIAREAKAGRTIEWEEAERRAKSERIGYGRGAYVTGTGTIGGLGGRLVGGRVGGPPGAIIGEAIGTGVGTYVGELTAPQAFEAVGAEPPEPVSQSEAITSGVYAGGASGVVTGALEGTKLAGRPVPNVRRRMEAFEEAGVTPKPADVSRSGTLARIERAMSQDPVGQARVGMRTEQQAIDLNRYTDELLDKVGEDATRVQLGTATRDQVDRVKKVTGARETTLYDDTRRLGGNTMVDITNLKNRAGAALREEQTYQRTPSLKRPGVEELSQELLGLPDQIPFGLAINYMKRLGAKVDRGALLPKAPKGVKNALWEGLRTDIETAAAPNPNLLTAFKEATSYAKYRRVLFEDADLRKILRTKPEDIPALLKLEGGPTYIQQARDAIHGMAPTPESQALWDKIRRNVLQGLLGEVAEGGVRKAVPGQRTPVIAGGALERRIGRVGRETIDALLTPDERRAFDNILLVSKAMEEGSRQSAARGTSATPQMLAFYQAMSALGLGVGHLTQQTTEGTIVGGLVGFGAGALKQFAIPAVLSRVVTSPRLARIIGGDEGSRFIKALRVGGVASAEVARMAARWAAIAKAESQREAAPTSPTSAVGNVMERMAAAEESPVMR